MDLLQASIDSLAGPLGYLILFFFVLVMSAVIFFPIPVTAFVIVAAGILDPLLVGIVAGIASSFGELSAYLLGCGGEKVLKKEKKEGEKYEKFKRFFDKYGFVGIVIAAFLPITPIDFFGLIAGSVRYGWKRFLFATMLGKIPRYLLVAYLGNAAIGYFF
jgi:membrane protein YqaA with SNARE-associated domain